MKQNDLPLEVPVVLHTSDEITKRMGYSPVEMLQLQSIMADDEEDSGEKRKSENIRA